MNETLVLFDFDGTLTKRDTLSDFIVFDSRPIQLFTRGSAVLPYYLLYKLGVISAKRAKEKIFVAFFGDVKRAELDRKALRYVQVRLPEILRKNAVSRLSWHKARGHEVAIVSASPCLWLKPWAESVGVTLISTRLQVIDDAYTGFIDGENCNGYQKVVNIKQRYDLESFMEIFAYGDSKGDIPMLGLAHYSFYKPFRQEF